MDLQLTDKHVLVTGGSRGIGLACARGFLGEGTRVSLVGRSQDGLDAALADLGAPGQRAQGFRADLRDAQAALSMLDDVQRALGPVDILVNSAGAAARVPFDELQPQLWADAMQAKFMTYVNVMDPLVKRMAERGVGVIVNIIGLGGKLAMPTHIAGGAANAALMLATAGLAAAYGRRGVRVVGVNPGRTLTQRMSQGIAVEARQRGLSEQDVVRDTESRLPLGRLAQPQEVADVVVFLASSRAAYVTGTTLSMDGAQVPTVL